MGRYAVAFFESMRPYRAAVAHLDMEDVSSQGALMWSVLQCHRVIEEFLLVEFEGHPVIVREMSIFMLTERVDPSQIASLLSKNQNLENEVKSLTKRMKTLEDTTTSLKRSLDSVTNELKQFKKNKS